MIARTAREHFRSFFRKEDGNFTMFAAIIMPICFAAGSLAIDFSNAISMKSKLQNASDAAALATSSQLTNGKITVLEAKTYAENFFNGMISEESASITATPNATITPIGSGLSISYQVKVEASGVQTLTPLAKFVGQDSMNIKTSATSKSGRDGSNPMSMMLVLDRSGSMEWASGQTTTTTTTEPVYCTRRVIVGYFLWYPIYGDETYQCGTRQVENINDIPKIDILKVAVGDLVDHIRTSDPSDQYARMGAVAFNSAVAETDKLTLNWDKDRVDTFTDALVAIDGTKTDTPMKWAYEKITGPTEINEHFSKNGSKTPSKFIVFMTDGKNDTGSATNNAYADSQTLSYCTQAKSKDVTIFTVAFQAPLEGQVLLKACATSLTNYYDADNASDLIDAFNDIGMQAAKMSTRLTQ